MKAYVYYPGCTLCTKAENLNRSAKIVSGMLGIYLSEIPDWICCGAAFPLVSDDLMSLVAPARILSNARKKGNRLVTLCSFCFNVLKRTNEVIRKDEEKREKLNNFIEEKYEGDVEVLHLLEVLRDDVGFEKIEKMVKRDIELKIVPYYGCQILRPKEIGIDDPENPKILEDLMKCLGCEVIEFPHKTECCGSYLSITSPEIAQKRSLFILDSAIKRANTIVLSCPLCYYNLYNKRKGISVFYFTELLEKAIL